MRIQVFMFCANTLPARVLQRNKNPGQDHPETAERRAESRRAVTTIIAITPDKPCVDRRDKQPPGQDTHFDELDAFFTELEKSGRKVMVVVVPEHGGALKGDRMQVSGLRDIPSPSITDVPVGVKFFGMKAPHQGAPIVIDQPSSFLAISDLVVRVLDGKIFSEDNVDWKKLTSGLPQTAPVSRTQMQ